MAVDPNTIQPLTPFMVNTMQKQQQKPNKWNINIFPKRIQLYIQAFSSFVHRNGALYGYKRCMMSKKYPRIITRFCVMFISFFCVYCA